METAEIRLRQSQELFNCIALSKKIGLSFLDNESARLFLEKIRWPHGATCPHCSADKPYVITARPDSKCKSRAGLYKCRICRCQFSVTVGTSLENTKIPMLKWALALSILAKNKSLSGHQLSLIIGVTQKTVCLMVRKIKQDAVFTPKIK